MSTLTAHTAAPLLTAQALTVEVGGRAVCRNLALTLAPGERLVILGRNGAGKSTLLATLAGLRDAAAGEVLLAGKSYADWSQHGSRLAAQLRGWLAQSQHDPFAATVLETALTGRHPHLGRWDWESAADRALAQQALAAVGLAGFDTREVHTLSGGERQRLAIAALLTQAPTLYLLDEPLTHLDLNHAVAVLDLFRARSEQAGAAVAMVLHDPGLAYRYGTRALLVFGDGTVEAGPVADILTAERLSRLYGHPLQEVTDAQGGRWFIPS